MAAVNNAIMRSFEITNGAVFEPIIAESVRGTAEISCPPSNTDNVVFEGDDGSSVEWEPGEYHDFVNIDFSTIKVKGTNGDKVTIIGGSW